MATVQQAQRGLLAPPSSTTGALALPRALPAARVSGWFCVVVLLVRVGMHMHAVLQPLAVAGVWHASAKESKPG